MNQIKRAFDQAWKGAERPGFWWVTMGEEGNQTHETARNTGRVAQRIGLPVLLREQDGVLVIEGQDEVLLEGDEASTPSEWGLPQHPLSSHMDVALANVLPGQVLGTEDGEIWTNVDQSGGAETFLELTDTPADYTGAANLFVRVNGAEDALVFDALAWADITDPPAEFPPSAHTHPITDITDIIITTPTVNQVLAYNGSQWVNQNPAALSDTGIFLLLAGRAGGQVANGGIAASENLTLRSTAHATKGKILFGTSAYDEVNDRLGIGIDSPTVRLYVKGEAAKSAAGGAVAYFTSNNVGTELALSIDLRGSTTPENRAVVLQSSEATIAYRALLLNPSGGFVGINLDTALPTSPLHVHSPQVGSAARLAQFYAPSADWVQFNIGRAGSSGNEGQFEWDAVNGVFKMQTNSHASPIQLGNQWVYITAAGNTLFGTNVDSYTHRVTIKGNTSKPNLALHQDTNAGIKGTFVTFYENTVLGSPIVGTIGKDTGSKLEINGDVGI
jgi:hypothetical protein